MERFNLYTDKNNKDDYLNNEGKFSIGNGFLNIRGSFEEGLNVANQNEEYVRMPANVTIEKQRKPISKFGIFCPEITGNHPLLKNQIVNLPYFIGIQIYYKDVKLDMIDSKVENFEMNINYKNGELERKFIWVINEKNISICFKRVAYLGVSNEIVQFLEMDIPEDLAKYIKIVTSIDTNITTNGYNHFLNIDLKHDFNEQLCHGETDSGDVFYINSQDYIDGLAISKNIIEDNIIKNEYVVNRNKISLTRISRLSTKEFCSPLDNTYESIVEKNIEILCQDWEKMEIKIEGNDLLQNSIDFAMYHLNRSQNRYSSDYAVCAKGFAGEGYFGHYFWDTEIYLLPFYLYTNPKRAKHLLEFRYNTLNSAIENAKKYGYLGAKYPWEANKKGEEQCANWQYADFEIHVSLDICFAFFKYQEATEDNIFFLEKGIPVIKEVLAYILDRLYVSKNGEVNINGVMGPDEYLFFTNNNYFTNFMAKYCAQKYLEESKKFGIQIDNESALKNLIENIVLPEQDGIILQCSNFEEFEELDIDKIWVDRSDYFGRYISQERNYRSKMLKQADVMLLLNLFPDNFELEKLEKCINYYEPITCHDSSLSKVIHAITYAKLQNWKMFDSFIEEAIGIDYIKKGCEEGIHIANQAAIIQSVYSGICGLKFGDDITFIENKLPESIDKVEVKIVYKSKRYHIIKTKNEVAINEII